MKPETPTIEFIAFCLQQSHGTGVVALRSILARIQDECLSPEGFLRLDDHALQSRFGLKQSAVSALRGPVEKTLDLWQRLRSESIQTLVLGYPGYPQRLAALLHESAPPILFAKGNTDLFGPPSVGFCGSRKASEKGLQVASECAQLLAKDGINIVSGYAHGVDLAAHKAALEAGGTTTLVLAEGILHFRLKEELRGVVRDGDFSRLLVISEFPPALPWRAHNAMARNRTICGLSNALVVIESGQEGGTFEAGKTALALHEPLFCVEYAKPSPSAAGNPYFLAHGAVSLKRARTGQPNLSKLIEAVRSAPIPNPLPQRQRQLLVCEEAKPYR